MSKLNKTPQLTPCRRVGLCRSIKMKTPLIDRSKNTTVNSDSIERTPCTLLKDKVRKLLDE